jgi:phage terminase small subunit
MAKLTNKQQRFIDEYLIDSNATQAAIRAGYSEKTAAIIGFENLRKPNVSKIIQKRRMELSNELQKRFVVDAIKAREVMYAILTDESAADKDKITVARDFLDRAGFKPPDKMEHSGGVKVSALEGATDEDLDKRIEALEKLVK